MATRKFFSIAFRNLVRNGRRTFLTALAVALGLVVVMAMSSMIAGMLETMVADGIRMTTGHLQVREESYDEDRASLLAEDLLEDTATWATQAEALPEVQSAAPVLWSGGLLSTPQESIGVQIVGIDTEDAFHDPIREGIVAGDFLSNDDRGQILIGRGLADEMGLGVGRRVSLAASNADGEAQEGIFTVAGLVDTGFPSIDQNRVILPLAQAQSFSGVGDRFSSLIVMLRDQDETAVAAARFAVPQAQVLTWEDLNRLILESMRSGLMFYYILYGIVFVAVAVLIANTLLMSVFARAQEIGILSALGMNRRQITLLFLIEGVLLALLGIFVGLVLGLGVVAYMTYVGFTIPADTATLVEGLAFGTTLKGGFAPLQIAALSFLLFVIVSFVSLYPASLAAKMEPVEALHSV